MNRKVGFIPVRNVARNGVKIKCVHRWIKDIMNDL